MSRYARNLVPVLIITALTAMMIYGLVLLVGPATGTTSTLVASGTGTLTCPRTGCTASSCHATSGAAGAAATNSGSRSGGHGTPVSWDDD